MTLKRFKPLWVPLALAAVALVAIQNAPAQELTAESPEAVRVIPYVMAAPRAALVPPPLDTSHVPMPAIGAAHNFPRRNGGLVVPVGAVVAFLLAPGIEGVWYPKTHGLLGTCLELEMRQPDSNQWVPLGRDGARAIRVGPSIGTADVKVRHRFNRPGRFILRGIIRTVAVPIDQNATEVDPANTDCPGAAVAVNKVFVHVTVVEGPAEVSTTTADPTDEATLELEPDEEATSEQ